MIAIGWSQRLLETPHLKAFRAGVEPLVVSPDNVLLTPHCAGGSIEAAVAMTERCVDNILAVRDGRARRGSLNPGALAG